MFHTWPVKIITTQASSRPTFECGKSADHAEHQAGQEAEHGNALQDVEDRDHDALGAAVVRGDRAVDEREGQRQHVGGEAARQRQQRVDRASAHSDRSMSTVGRSGAVQRRASADHPGDQRRQAEEDQGVDPPC